MPDPKPILCEIRADARVGADLAHIVEFCAQETGLTIEVAIHEARTTEPVLTLHASVDQATSQNPILCLACRLACFCPQARVGMLVHAVEKFRPPRPRRPVRRRHSA